MIRILLVDDDDNNSLILSALLEEEGFIVDTASSLREARAMLSQQPKLLLLDLHLGDGLGISLIPEVRAALPSTKIILVSGAKNEHPEANIDGSFLKGEDFTSLLTLIQQMARD